MPQLKVFYHVCAVGPWRDVVHDQLSKLLFSGLYHACQGVMCCISGPEAHAAAAFVTDYGAKVTVLAIEPKDESHERLTLLRMRHHVSPDDRVLYIHSKGVTKGGDARVAHWRYAMEFFLIAKWRDCVAALGTGVNVVGINYRDTPSPHFSGNFWWCTGAHVLALPHAIGPDYCDPEFYVLSVPCWSLRLTDTAVNHYETPFPMARFVDL